MTRPITERYRASFVALEALFGAAFVHDRLSRMEAIHAATDASWRDYVSRLRRRPVRYLLIAEAPPWSESGPIQYLLAPASRPRTLMRALRRAFLSDGQVVSASAMLALLADHGFLLVDSLPFSMRYSSGVRVTRAYGDLMLRSIADYLQPQLSHPDLRWHPSVRIAFSVRRNAEAVIRSAPLLMIDAKPHRLSPEMIAVGRNNYPDALVLRRLWGLPGR